MVAGTVRLFEHQRVLVSHGLHRTSRWCRRQPGRCHWSHARVGGMGTRRCGTAAESSPGTDAWTGERVPRDGHLARSWRSSPWLQQLQGSLEHAPAASACSAECCALPAARRSRAVDIVEIFLFASTGTASAWRRPPALLGRRPDATTGRLGPVAARAVRLVPSAASVRAWKVAGL